MAPLLSRSWARFLSRLSCSNTQLLGGKRSVELLLSWPLGFCLVSGKMWGMRKGIKVSIFIWVGFLFTCDINIEKEKSENIRSGKLYYFLLFTQ